MSPQHRYSKVSRRIWNDAGFRRLSPIPPCGQGLVFRLLTAPECTCIPGLFQAWEAGLAQAMGWDLKAFREAFGEAFREGMVEADWSTGLVWLPNAIKHNTPVSPNVIRSWAEMWAELPECPLKDKAYRALKAFCEGMGEAFGEAFGEAIADPSPNQEQEKEQDQEENDPPEQLELTTPPVAEPDPVREVFDHWRQVVWSQAKGGREPKLTEERQRTIRARLRSYSLDDLREVLTRASKSRFHMGENDGSKFYGDIDNLIGSDGKVDKWLASPEPNAHAQANQNPAVRISPEGRPFILESDL